MQTSWVMVMQGVGKTTMSFVLTLDQDLRKRVFLAPWLLLNQSLVLASEDPA